MVSSLNDLNYKVKNITFERKYNYGARYPYGLSFDPEGKRHGEILTRLMALAVQSKNAMRARYDSWQDVDKSLTAYIDLTEDEDRLKQKDPRNPISIVVPVTFATMDTLLTFLTAAFLNPPIFRYDPVSEEDVVGAALLERVIQLHCHRFRVGLPLHTIWKDAFAYNLGCGAPVWTVKRGMKKRKSTRFRLSDPTMYSIFAPMEQVEEDVMEEAVLYEGNELLALDPYQLLPDTNISIDNIQKGEFIGWVTRTNRMELIGQEREDSGMFNVKYLEQLDGRSLFMEERPDERDRYDVMGTNDFTVEPVDVMWMYVKLIPREWKLGPSRVPEKWVFAVAGDCLIIKAHPLDLQHDMFPVVVCSPDYDGHTITSPSRLEIMDGMQKTVNFLYNSHFANVRKAINDMFIVDPQMVVMSDLKRPFDGLLIRLRQKFWGQGKLADAVQQFKVADVTSNHMVDVENVNSLIERATGATENLQGLRRTTSERVSAREAQNIQMNAVSRMEKAARIIDLMTMQPLAFMFAHHAQQFMESGQWVKILGRGEEDLRMIFGNAGRTYAGPDDLSVAFDVVDHGGAIPGSGDPQLLMQLWQTAATSPIAPSVDLLKMFLYVAKAMGAKNVQDFVAIAQKMPQPNVVPMEQIQQQVGAGNMIPLSEAQGA